MCFKRKTKTSTNRVIVMVCLSIQLRRSMHFCRVASAPLPLLLWLATGVTSVRTLGHIADADGVHDLVSSGASSSSESVPPASTTSDHTSCDYGILCDVLRHIDTSLEPTPADMVDSSEEQTENNSSNLISPDNSSASTIRSHSLHRLDPPGTYNVATTSLLPQDFPSYNMFSPPGRLHYEHLGWYYSQKNLPGLQSEGRGAA